VVKKVKKTGFSLTEVLLSIGILAVGMLFIAGVFPVGIYYSSISTERTTAAVVADEAFAKIKLYGVEPVWLAKAPLNKGCHDVNDISAVRLPGYWEGRFWRRYEYYYPSIGYRAFSGNRPDYIWAALCRRIGPRDVQATVFVCKNLGSNRRYYRRLLLPYGRLREDALNPLPVFVNVRRAGVSYPDRLYIEFDDTYDYPDIVRGFINDGCTIVDDETGRIYRVLKRFADNPDTVADAENRIIQLDRPFEPGPVFANNFLAGIRPQGRVWVIPPPVGGGKSPCVAVYQKVLRF